MLGAGPPLPPCPAVARPPLLQWLRVMRQRRQSVALQCEQASPSPSGWPRHAPLAPFTALLPFCPAPAQAMRRRRLADGVSHVVGHADEDEDDEVGRSCGSGRAVRVCVCVYHTGGHAQGRGLGARAVAACHGATLSLPCARSTPCRGPAPRASFAKDMHACMCSTLPCCCAIGPPPPPAPHTHTHALPAVVVCDSEPKGPRQAPAAPNPAQPH